MTRSLLPMFTLSFFKRRKVSSLSLPDELLLFIFQDIAGRVDTTTAYKDLISLQLVSRQWGRVARAILYARVELARSDDVLALAQTLEASTAAGQSLDIDTLVVGVGSLQTKQLDRVLVHAPGIRKLVVLATDQATHITAMEPPERLSLLTSLEIGPQPGARQLSPQHSNCMV